MKWQRQDRQRSRVRDGEKQRNGEIQPEKRLQNRESKEEEKNRLRNTEDQEGYQQYLHNLILEIETTQVFIIYSLTVNIW